MVGEWVEVAQEVVWGPPDPVHCFARNTWWDENRNFFDFHHISVGDLKYVQKWFGGLGNHFSVHIHLLMTIL